MMYRATVRVGMVAILAAVLILVFVSGMALFRGSSKPVPSVSTGQALIASRFELTDHAKRTVTHQTFAGKWQLVFFGFTHCPDVCPTTLSAMSLVLDKLGTRADKIAPLFITVDPTRDTPDVLREYLAAFHPSIVGLTGTEAGVQSAAKSFRIYYSRNEQAEAPGGYLMNHSGYIYLMRPDGSYETHFSEKSDTADKIVTSIRKRIPE